MKPPPINLVEAVKLINSFNRLENIDPELVLISQCERCEEYFVSLPADEAYKQANGKPSLCRNCARIRQAELLRERQRKYRQNKKNSKENLS